MSGSLLPREELDAPPEISDAPVFIGGLDRSGKTTMRGFLTSHPHIAIPAVGSNMETYFYGQYGDLADPRNLERCLQAMLRYKHVRSLKPDAERIRREFAEGPPSYERLFSLFLIQYAEREGKPRWGAQTGLIERYADEVFAAFPAAKVLHMVRDPRDRYEASLALWPDGKGRAGGATARWTYSVGLAERNLRRYPSGYLVVRFEDMVRRPEETVRQVCGFLEEPFVPQMLAMPEAEKHRALLSSGSSAPTGGTVMDESFIGRFRGRILKRELAFIQGQAGRRMRAYGYAPDPTPMSLGERARFVAIDWPNQEARMLAWRGVETLQQRFPARVGRKPGGRMIVEPVTDDAAGGGS